MRGLVAARVLQEVERRMGRRSADVFGAGAGRRISFRGDPGPGRRAARRRGPGGPGGARAVADRYLVQAASELDRVAAPLANATA